MNFLHQVRNELTIETNKCRHISIYLRRRITSVVESLNSLSIRANVHGLDCQNVSGLWVRVFVGNWFAAIQFKTIPFVET